MWPLGHAINVAATPFTNTLAIHRLALAPGECAELTGAYIVVPAPALSALKQRPTCLDARADGGLYKDEGLFRGDFPLRFPSIRKGWSSTTISRSPT